MNWDRIAGTWKQIQATYGITRQANEERLAEWRARQHKVDPIHK